MGVILPPPLSPEQLAYLKAHIKDDKGPRIIAISVTFIVMCSLSVGLRFVARNVRKLSWEADDYLMVPALVGSPTGPNLGLCHVADGLTGVRFSPWPCVSRTSSVSIYPTGRLLQLPDDADLST